MLHGHLWLVFTVAALTVALACDVGEISFDQLAWIFSANNACGFVTDVLSFTYAFIVDIWLIFTNFATISIHLKKKKNTVIVLSPGNISSQINLHNHQWRERNLFVQCTISTIAYLACISVFALTIQLDLLPDLRYHIVAQLINSMIIWLCWTLALSMYWSIGN